MQQKIKFNLGIDSSQSSMGQFCCTVIFSFNNLENH